MRGTDCDSAVTAGRPGASHRRGGSACSSRRTRLLLVTLGLLAAALVLSSSSLAGEPRHVFGSSLKGTEKCEFSEPSGVAVNEQTHDVFVYDRSSNSINWLDAGGHCILHHQSGKGTSGEEGKEGFAIDNSGGPSAGDLYVANAEEHAILKFKPEVVEGKPVLKRIQTIKRFRKKEVGAEEFLFEEEVHGIAVDASGGLWVYAGERTILGFSGGVPNEALSITEAGGECPARRGFAVSGDAESFYVAKERENHKRECEESASLMKLNSAGEPVGEPAFNAQLDNENITGVAVDKGTGHVYADNGTNVSAFDTGGVFIQRFGNEAGSGQLHESLGITVNSATDTVYAADSLEGKVNLYVPNPSQEPTGEPQPELADGRKWEMVSPSNKFGAAIFGISAFGGIVQASEDGSAITYTATAPITGTPSTNRSPEPAQELSRRGSQSWATDTISTPHPEVPAGFKTGGGPEYEFFSADLSSGLTDPGHHGLEPPTPPPLSPEASESTPYWRNLTVPTASCEPTPSGCYQALVSKVNDTTGKPFGREVGFTSATPDASHSVLKSKVALTGEATEEQGLYEWDRSGALHLVSILPTAEASGSTTEAKLGGPGEEFGGIMRHAISDDGSRIIWSKEENHGTGEAPLYMRDMSKGETIRVDKAATGIEEPEEPGAIYQTASADGSKIFFTDTKRLTPDATIEEPEEEGIALGDLYVCEVVEGVGGKLGCKLTDLTTEVAHSTEGVASESAAVQGVIGASEQGTYVYFLANGALASGSPPGHCVPRNGAELKEEAEGKLPVLSCSLYVEHFNGTSWDPPKFIAVLTTEDVHDWLAITTGGGGLATMTSRVSPNGQHLAFMSNRSLTGYDNADAAHPNVRDEEVFLYDLASERIVCASCNVDNNVRPNGVFDIENAGEGKGLAIDRQQNWDHRWLAASLPGWTARSRESALVQSRYLSDSGRLFFNATGGLVPADKNGKADVYEFEPKGEGSCTSQTGCVSLISSGTSANESAFVEASVSGGDVFFLTSEKLLPQDIDTGFDIYDAHVCTDSSPCQTPSESHPSKCEAEPSEANCRAAQTSVAAPPSAPPSTLPGTGNQGKAVLGEVKKKPPPVETRQQKLKKALKACHKLKKKKKRVACEKQARKKYGSSKKATKKSAKSGKSSRKVTR